MNDYKVVFEYESYVFKDTEFPVFKKLTKCLVIIGLVVGARIAYQNIKKLMKKGNSENMFDFNAKKIEAIRPENINTLFKDVAGMH